MCHVEGEGRDTSMVAPVHYGGARRRYGRSMCSWPMYSWMRAVMHEKRFALHGHKSTDGLNVEEEIGETTVVGIYVHNIRPPLCSYRLWAQLGPSRQRIYK